MKNLKKLLTLAICVILTSCSAVILTACGSDEEGYKQELISYYDKMSEQKELTFFRHQESYLPYHGESLNISRLVYDDEGNLTYFYSYSLEIETGKIYAQIVILPKELKAYDLDYMTYDIILGHMVDVVLVHHSNWTKVKKIGLNQYIVSSPNPFGHPADYLVTIENDFISQICSVFLDEDGNITHQYFGVWYQKGLGDHKVIDIDESKFTLRHDWRDLE